jgi:pimeloyl-ACP methyl ester carboxylesterase
VTPIRSPDGVTFEACEWGRPDVVPPTIAEITHQLIPQSTLSIYHGVCHSSFFEAPDRFNAELDRFAAGLAKSR